MGEVAARNAVAVVFALNGFAFSCLFARLADVRSGLDLTNGDLGILLLTLAGGSLVALVASGRVVARLGAAAGVRLGCAGVLAGLLLAALGLSVPSLPLTVAGFVLYGAGSGAWDVAMNVEAAAVERVLGRTIMPRFHAGWSLGSFGGAGIGVLLTGAGVGPVVHLAAGGVLAATAAAVAVRRFPPTGARSTGPTGGSRARSAWTDPRTLALGVMVLCFAAAEGAANDWLALALIDGYEAPQWLGVAGFAGFVCAMTFGRLVGPVAIDRYGRLAVIAAGALGSAAGVLLVVLGGAWPLVAVGIVLWGLGAALGFPVGMSAAADDPTVAAQRVSVVATIGYGAFFAGPPLLGALGDAVGILEALLVVSLLMLVAVASAGAVREGRERQRSSQANPSP
ncbi:MAG TPA: MFS transporter [Nocardioides sp.]|nr:MFS transporter [Nocardioides sp.]